MAEGLLIRHYWPYNVNYEDKEVKVLYWNNFHTNKLALNHESIQNNRDKHTCNGVDDITIFPIKNRKILTKHKKRRKCRDFDHVKQQSLKRIRSSNEVSNLCSTKIRNQKVKLTNSSEILSKRSYPFQKQFVVNVFQERKVRPYINKRNQIEFKIYRCQFGAKEESCCCSCNSDAMFEVMKSLYDCYKRKDCNNCNCILCSHLPREERRLSELRKSAMALETASMKQRRKEISKRSKDVRAKLIGKPAIEKEKILRDLAMSGVPLPEAQTPSEKEIMKKLRNELGLPPEPTTAAEREKIKKAEAAGVLVPLEGKTPEAKEKILRKQAQLGILLPEGRTPSEKSLIKKIKGEVTGGSPSDRLRKAKVAGFLTPLAGKTKAQKENILKGLAKAGIPLPEPKTSSERALMDKVRAGVGLSPEPKTAAEREKYKKATDAGIITPLEGKTPEQKEKILRAQREMGIALPEGRTPSEKSLIAKIKASPKILPSGISIPADKIKKARATGLLTPLTGKTPEQKEKILKKLAELGLPLPKGKTQSEQKIIDKVRQNLGLPHAKTDDEKRNYKKGIAAGIIQPLEGKSRPEKEKILKGLHDMGIPLPEGRSSSEKSMIEKIKASSRRKPTGMVPEKLLKTKTAGLITPLEGKTPEQMEKKLRSLAMQGVSLPEGKTPLQKELVKKVRADLGLPPEPKTALERENMKKAEQAGALVPLEGKTLAEKENILRKQAELGILLPEGRTMSEKSLIKHVKAGVSGSASDKLRKAKAAGLLTPLEGKTRAQKENIVKGLAKAGIPLPEPKTSSERKLMDKVRAEIGLPPEPKTAAEREKHKKATVAGIITPLEGKTPEQKEKILRAQREMGLSLPEGRTPSEKSLIAKIKAAPKILPSGISIPADKIKNARAAGLLTPLQGKTPDQKEKILRGLAAHGIPFPEGKTPSEKKLISKVKAELGEKKTPTAKSSKSERYLSKSLTSDRLRIAKAAGLITPLKGKTPQQKENIVRGLAMQGLPLPEGKTPSEKEIISKVRADLGLPPEPKTTSEKEKYNKALKAGIIAPLEGKSGAEKEKILKAQHDMGIPLPEGRTSSEKALIDKIKSLPRGVSKDISSEKLRKAKAAGLITPFKGKTLQQKEKIVRGLAMQGLPLPEGHTPSEKKLINKMRVDLGLPPAPKSTSEKEKYNKALKAGIIVPLEGKSGAEKEQILKRQHDMGVPLPQGRTSSEKALINKIKTMPRGISDISSEKLRKAKAAGLITPLEGKTPEQKEKILRNLAMHGIPLPEGKSPSEKKLLNRVRADIGLPPEPKTAAERVKHNNAIKAGIIQPLEGKTGPEKEKIIKGQHNRDMPLPEGRTRSEKSMIAKIKAMPREPVSTIIQDITSDKIRSVKAAGLLTPLDGKTPAQKEKILRGLAQAGLPLPEGKTISEKSLIRKMRKARVDGLITPLTGKIPAQKERIIRGLATSGLPIPEGTTASEKDLIRKIRNEVGQPSEKKDKVRTKSKKISVRSKKSVARGLAGKQPPVGVTEEFEDIIKTTTCDRGCGCDKKKIKFKHSYVKIKVTSPDISSLCPCPDDCFPIKTGIITDSEGIKVTVGRATGVPSFSLHRYVSNIIKNNGDSDLIYLTKRSQSKDEVLLSKKACHKKEKNKLVKYILRYDGDFQNTSADNMLKSCECCDDVNSTFSDVDVHGLDTDIETCENDARQSVSSYTEDYYILSTDSTNSYTQNSFASSTSSLESIVIIKSDSSVSLYTNSCFTQGTMSFTSLESSLSTKTNYMLTGQDIISVLSLYTDTSSDTFKHKADISWSTKYIKDGHGQRIYNDRGRDGIMANKLSQNYVNNYFYRSRKKDVSHTKIFRKSNSLVRTGYTSRTKKVNQLLNIPNSTNETDIFLLVPTSDDYNSENYGG